MLILISSVYEVHSLNMINKNQTFKDKDVNVIYSVKRGWKRLSVNYNKNSLLGVADASDEIGCVRDRKFKVGELAAFILNYKINKCDDVFNHNRNIGVLHQIVSINQTHICTEGTNPEMHWQPCCVKKQQVIWRCPYINKNVN